MKKRCPKCEKTKPTTSFNKNATQGDGLCGYCRPCTNKYYKAYSKTARHRTMQKNRKVRINKRDKLKSKARSKLNNALAGGKIEKKPCYFCDEKKVQAHHPLYEFPLKVLWVCRQHHSDVHITSNDEKEV